MAKKILEADVLSNEEIISGIRKLILYVPDAAKAARPGQFVNIYPKNPSTILPRPISISDADTKEGTLSIVYAVVGKGTEEFSKAERGDIMKISSPLGNGFNLDFAGGDTDDSEAPKTALLIGGGIGIAPMVFTAKKLASMGLKCTVAAGFKKDTFLVDELEAAGAKVIVTTETATENAFMGNVVDCMSVNGLKADYYMACGPRPMLAAVSEFIYGEDADADLQVSMEERMGCGYGVCVGCVVDVIVNNDNGDIATAKKKVCKDGPVFRGNEVIW